MFAIHFSNRFQHLLDHMLDAIASSTTSPFAPIEMVIPSAAIQRKLELAIAKRHGVCANIRFSYLGQWIWRQMGKVTPVPDISPFAPETLAWRILKILDNPSFVLVHSRLRSWMESADPVMRYELASEIASLIDQVITYRPNLIEAWSSNKLICIPGGTRTAGQDQQWQAELWRRILHETGSERHLPAMLKKLDSLDESSASKLRQSEAVHIFCPPTIAPLTIEMLNRFSKWMDLRLYVLNPCREYWFDIVDRKRLSYLHSAGKADHHEMGNSLLASWGKQTQAMIDLLFENTTLTCDEAHSFTSNAELGRTSLLAQVQDAMLDLRDFSDTSSKSAITLAPDDRSIEIHVCHSLTRELEVLQDQLLALFAGDTPPAPDEVLVVTPDLKNAAPLIDAVFGTSASARAIPYTITGLGNSRVNPVAVALLDLLSIAPSRFTSSAVYKLLQQPIIAQRFGLDENNLQNVHQWMTDSGIRWGLDGKHRREMQLPDDEHHSFRDGLHRLFLSYALPAGAQTPFHARLPASNIQGTESLVLGRFSQFVKQLEDLHQQLASEKNAQAWRLYLVKLLGDFTAAHDNQIDDMNEVLDRINALCDNIQRSAEDYPLSRDVMLRALTQALDDPARGGVPTGTVTFTAMSSLRNLPYRVICAIGLNSGAFPSTQRALEFDLIAHAPKRGDRQRRLDERNIFLDLLLAAQDRFYLSYTGRNIRDNSEQPPSTLISDLLDALAPAIGPAARERLVVEHPLQAFSQHYYTGTGDPRIASSNREYHDALLRQAAAATTHTAAHSSDLAETANDFEGEEDEADTTANTFITPFLPVPLPTPDETQRHITLDQLIRFFNHPSRYLLRERLGIRFPETDEELADDEPFLPEWREQRALSERLLPMFLSDVPLESIRETALASNEYPSGRLGQTLIDQDLRNMAAFAQTIQTSLSLPCFPPTTITLPFTIDGESWTLTHTFNDLRANGLVRYRYDDARARDYLNGWLVHLFLNASTHAAMPLEAEPKTTWYARDGMHYFNPVPDALTELETLVALYRRGLCEPLHFYPKSSWEYVRRGNHLQAARNTWKGRDNGSFAESQDPYYRQALRGIADPLDASFAEHAQTVWSVMLRYLVDSRSE